MFNKVQEVNKILEDRGAKVVQKKPSFGNRGALYGYIPQAVFSAVASTVQFSNTVNWFEFTEKQAIVQVTVTIGQESHTQFGESQIVKSKNGKDGGDVGSAAKGAVTDAIQKALALFGIGAKAYLGELEATFNNKVSQTEVDDNFEALKGAAKKTVDKEAGRMWWRQNLTHIQILTDGQREEIVKILGAKK